MRILLTAWTMLILGLFACSMDYDEFGESPYHQFSGIVFEEQDGEATAYPDEHKMVISLKKAPDSLKRWDSVTVQSIDMSNMATLHLVESKILEFPTDSAALDSLANQVAYVEKKLKKGKRLYLPASRTLYVVIIAENGDMALWQLQLNVASEESEGGNSQNGDSQDGEKQSNGDEKSGGDNKSGDGEGSAAQQKSSAAEFDVLFENQARLDPLDDTLVVTFPFGTDLSKVTLDSWSVSPKASISPSPDTLKSWKESQTFKVTAEDGSVRNWTLKLAVAKATEVLSISATGQTKNASIDATKESIVLYLPSEESLKSVNIESITLSEGATHNLALMGLDLSSDKKFTVTASDGESKAEWTISAQVFKIVAPKLLSIKVGSGNVAGTIDEELGTVFFDMNYKTDLKLCSLKVQSVELSEDASADGIKAGSIYDFSREKTLTVSNSVGDSKTYTLKAGYQYPGSDFNHWINDTFGNKNDIDGWDNGNNDAIDKTKTLTVNEDEQVVKMVSQDAKVAGLFGKFASGNMLVAYFNPKGENALAMSKYDDGNELIDFGRPFYGRPKYVEFDVKYEGKGDSCDLYVILEHRSRTSNEGKNQYRTSNDVNTMVASAWYRATTVTSTDDPDVVSITDASRSGYKTIRLAFKYGKPITGSPIFKSSLFSTSLKNSKGIDNHVVQTESPDNFDVTHIRVVMASSALGNEYKGTVGATLWADEMRLIY